MIKIPVIDIFAGPGGLGEGFSAYNDNNNSFSISLSIEKDEFAHSTLELRSFYRKFNGNIPADYYLYLKGDISKSELFQNHPNEYRQAQEEAICAELGSKKNPPAEIDDKIKKALNGSDDWVLIGGPPCQAYSLVGRARRKNDSTYFNDPKHYLYKEYLRILAVHSPSVFIMENVKGILTSREKSGNQILHKILSDLHEPNKNIENGNGDDFKYNIYSLVTGKIDIDNFKPENLIVKSENYGIPQARHRVILLGIREDINIVPGTLIQKDHLPLSSIINDLPKIRSKLSKRKKTETDWHKWIKGIPEMPWLKEINDKDLSNRILQNVKSFSNESSTGANYFPEKSTSQYQKKWFNDSKLKGTLNHESRSHMASDLHRYFFCSCYAEVYDKSPKLGDFPKSLLPDHKNIDRALNTSLFSDRFRVQLSNIPATTVTSHISKDGHYFIHPDPFQCRSLTVREAARIQTFPDNYFFEGPRTQQFHQVGNAVPPLLSNQIAGIVSEIFSKL